MVKTKDSPSKSSRRSKKKTALVGVTSVLILYLIGLINPLTGPHLQYPYYELSCGRKPVLGSSFMARTYHTPDMRGYRVSMYSKLYCTEEEAQADGYRKSMSLPSQGGNL